jgi:Fe2+ or Zn2+ uptake regulation protein
MKRGRPALRATFRSRISDFLRQHPYPVTTRTIQHNLLSTGKPSSWHNVRKYLDELAQEGIITRQPES